MGGGHLGANELFPRTSEKRHIVAHIVLEPAKETSQVSYSSYSLGRAKE